MSIHLHFVQLTLVWHAIMKHRQWCVCVEWEWQVLSNFKVCSKFTVAVKLNITHRLSCYNLATMQNDLEKLSKTIQQRNLYRHLKRVN